MICCEVVSDPRPACGWPLQLPGPATACPRTVSPSSARTQRQRNKQHENARRVAMLNMDRRRQFLITGSRTAMNTCIGPWTASSKNVHDAHQAAIQPPADVTRRRAHSTPMTDTRLLRKRQPSAKSAPRNKSRTSKSRPYICSEPMLTVRRLKLGVGKLFGRNGEERMDQNKQTDEQQTTN